MASMRKQYPPSFRAKVALEVSMACITTLLKQVMSFVIGVTLNLVRYLKTWDKSYKKD